MNSGLSRCTEIQDRRIQQKLSVEGRISKSSCNCAFLSTAWTQRLQTSLANHSKYELQLDQQESSRSNQLMWVLWERNRCLGFAHGNNIPGFQEQSGQGQKGISHCHRRLPQDRWFLWSKQHLVRLFQHARMCATTSHKAVTADLDQHFVSRQKKFILHHVILKSREFTCWTRLHAGLGLIVQAAADHAATVFLGAPRGYPGFPAHYIERS